MSFNISSLNITSLNISASTAIVVLVASLAVSVGAGSAVAAADRDRAAATTTHRVHSVRAADRRHHRPHVVRRSPMPIYDYNRGTEHDYNHPRETPGYVFVPGKGILGESCNMPTSTCTNEYRDVQ
jgi:hypothetical protein